MPPRGDLAREVQCLGRTGFRHLDGRGSSLLPHRVQHRASHRYLRVPLHIGGPLSSSTPTPTRMPRLPRASAQEPGPPSGLRQTLSRLPTRQRHMLARLRRLRGGSIHRLSPRSSPSTQSRRGRHDVGRRAHRHRLCPLAPTTHGSTMTLSRLRQLRLHRRRRLLPRPHRLDSLTPRTLGGVGLGMGQSGFSRVAASVGIVQQPRRIYCDDSCEGEADPPRPGQPVGLADLPNIDPRQSVPFRRRLHRRRDHTPVYLEVCNNRLHHNQPSRALE